MLQAQGRQPHEEVRSFYERHYSSNIMKGAIIRESLGTAHHKLAACILLRVLGRCVEEHVLTEVSEPRSFFGI